MLSILSSAKGFDDRWIGHPALNRRDLHVRRVRLAARAAAMRRRLARRGADEWTAALARDGFVAVPDLLPAPAFEVLRDEVMGRLARAEADHPPPDAAGSGFGTKRPFPGGFDRYDGGTLNRFLDIPHARAAPFDAFTRSPTVDRLCRAANGGGLDPAKLQIYLTRNGDETVNGDLQKVLHKDTFHSSLKFWFFLTDVGTRNGPFTYVPGSHRMTPERLAWERTRARRASGLEPARDPHDLGGSFRVTEDELPALGLSAPVALPVRANTLVLADTLGFHRRGDADPGTERVALYGWRRSWPFAFWPG